MIDLCSLPVKSANAKLVFNNKLFSSPFNNQVQAAEFSGAQWHISLTYSLDYENACRLRGALAELNGVLGTCAIYPVGFHKPRGSGSGNPSVAALTPAGKSVQTVGWAGMDTVLKAGDHVEINGELKVVIADVATNGQGGATLLISPALRKPVPAGTVITVHKPRAQMRLKDDQQLDFDVQPGQKKQVTIQFVERIS